MPRTQHRLLAASLSGLAALALSGTAWADREVTPAHDAAHADVDPSPGALALFRQGRTYMSEGRYHEACRKFADSQKLDPGAGTMLNLAYCYEKIRRTASAWAVYREAAEAAHNEGRLDWENAALTRAAQLERTLLRAIIKIEQQASGDQPEILIDGTPLPSSVWGEKAPLSPGRHEVLATARESRPWSATFEVDADHVSTVTIPALDPVRPTETMLPARVTTRPTEAEQGSATSVSGQRLAAIAMAGAGGVALGVALGFAVAANATYDGAGANCFGAFCNRTGMDAQSRAYGELSVARVAATAGGAALVGGAILWFTAPARRSGFDVRPAMGRTAWSVTLEAGW